MAKANEFIRRINLKASKIPENANKIKRKAALAIDQTVVLATPVDTGRARSNWLVQLNSPETSPIEPYSPGKKLGKSDSANASAAIAQGLSVIAQAKPGDTIYISNNLDYIAKLNAGSSQQAPSMFVEKSIDAAIQAISGERLLK
jgi:hypothetical protein